MLGRRSCADLSAAAHFLLEFRNPVRVLQPGDACYETRLTHINLRNWITCEAPRSCPTADMSGASNPAAAAPELRFFKGLLNFYANYFF
jgi:hypothetical protein